MAKNQAKTAIKSLVEKYEAAKVAGKIGKYSEEDTKKDLILPLFAALGWDVYNRNEVTAEESVSHDRVDYGFYQNGRVKFYLEAKPLKADIHREEYARQAIKYSWNKGVTWAVLTDFESMIVFNAMSTERSLGGKLYFEISYTEYLSRFDQLWLLSKPSFETDDIDIEARKVGKLVQKISVGEQLYKDLNACRQDLTHSFVISNEGLKDQHLIDEGVQKLLNRLIFIRVAEDRKVEPLTLVPLIHQWEAGGRKGTPFSAMVSKFRELDEIYNSNIFDLHPFEKWDELDGATQRVVEILYGKKGYVEYDFSVIPADVLGAVYEDYLGYKLQQSQSKKDLFGADLELSKDSRKRKEQGIYYTPTFIVDYIVKNALGPVLNRCRSIYDLKKVKILDPACGSGSFLIRVMDLIAEKYKEFGATKIDAHIKVQILLDNIYGVDLDEQAVEIARLNLLLNTFDSQTRLPKLDSHVKNGNSLISGSDEELKKYFGKNFRDKKPFNWDEEFPEVFAQGGFDCIIGNPPWGAEIDISEKKYYKENFVSGGGIIDTYALFTEKAIRLLSGNGSFGFVLPDIVLLKNYPNIRKYVLDNCIVTHIKYSGMAFRSVNIDSVVLVLRKEKSTEKRNKNIINVSVENNERKIKQKLFLENEGYKFNLYFDNNLLDLKRKLDEQSMTLGEMAEIHEGVHSGNIRQKLFIEKMNQKNYKKLFFKGIEVNKYSTTWGGKYVNYDKAIINKADGEYANLGKPEYFDQPKILVRRTGDKLIAALDEEKYVASNNFFVLYPKTDRKIDLRFVLAILNSYLGTWYFMAVQPRKGRLFAEIKINHLKLIPIKNLNKKEVASYKLILRLVDRIQFLNKRPLEIHENSNGWKKQKSEIEKTDKKIDKEVYKLYGLTPEEVKIVEGNTK